MKKNHLKLFLDLAITVILILMFSRHATGQFGHEVLGLVLSGLFVVHLALNWSWIKNVTTNLFSSKISTKTKTCFWLSVFLVVGGALTLISGILISKTLLPNMFNFSRAFKELHEVVPNLGVLFVIAHLCMNWRWLAAMFKRLNPIQES